MRQLNCLELEEKLISPKDYSKHKIPDSTLKIANNETKEGVPTGIGFDSKLGFFVLQTSGQGPYLIWTEK